MAASETEDPALRGAGLGNVHHWVGDDVLENKAETDGLQAFVERAGCDCQPPFIVQAPFEIAEEFFSSTASLNGEQRAFLLSRGATEKSLIGDPWKVGPIRSGKVIIAKDGLFDFPKDGEGGVNAYLLLARDEFGAPTAIVAFNNAGNVATSVAIAMLGAQNVYAPRLGNEVLRVATNIYDWLAVDREGVLIVDFRRAAIAVLGLPLIVDSVEFGMKLEAKLTLKPRVFVRPCP